MMPQPVLLDVVANVWTEPVSPFRDVMAVVM